MASEAEIPPAPILTTFSTSSGTSAIARCSESIGFTSTTTNSSAATSSAAGTHRRVR